MWSFTLEHGSPDDFDLPQFGSGKKVSFWYLLYRVAMAMFFPIVYVVYYPLYQNHVVSTLIHMTSLNIILFTVSAILEAYLVIKRFLWEWRYPGSKCESIDQLKVMIKA